MGLITESVSFSPRMELIKAVREQDVEKVKVRRPLVNTPNKKPKIELLAEF